MTYAEIENKNLLECFGYGFLGLDVPWRNEFKVSWTKFLYIFCTFFAYVIADFQSGVIVIFQRLCTGTCTRLSDLGYPILSLVFDQAYHVLQAKVMTKLTYFLTKNNWWLNLPGPKQFLICSRRLTNYCLLR